MRRLFLESPYLLAPLLAVAVYVLLAFWLRRRTPQSKRAVWIGLLLSMALLFLQAAVVTDQERLRLVCGELVRATQAGDVDAIAAQVSARFDVRGTDRDEFLARVTQTLTRVRVENARVRYGEIVVRDDRADVRFRVNCRVVASEAGPIDVLGSAWLAGFAREGDAWRLIAVDPQPTPSFPVGRLEDLWR